MQTDTHRSVHAWFLTLLLAVGVSIFPGEAHAQTVFYNPDYAYVVDIPVGWELLDAESTSMVSFTDPDHVAVFQLLSFPGSQFATVQEIERYVSRSFGARGDTAPFRYNGDHALFADYEFTAGTVPVHGYMVFVNRSDFDFAVMTFAAEDYFEAQHDNILSALDSFSPSAATRNLPGPVSQFYRNDIDDGNAGATLVLPGGTTMEIPGILASDGQREASQVVIEREARLLLTHQPGSETRYDESRPPQWVQAWRRYFRMIYRDNYERMAPVAEAIYRESARGGVSRDQLPAHLLTWLQGAGYERTASLSDFASPGSCLATFTGDCDSLGMTYAILLHHLGFEAILMASVEYSHAMVGVDMPGAGARFSYEGRDWLVAELTANVAIGQIAQNMADPAGWIGVKLDPTVQW